MSCSFGTNIKITIFGQSHSPAIGVVIDGIPAGIKLDQDKIYKFMQRRAPGNSDISTPRKEEDFPNIVSGVVDNITCGAPICAIVENRNVKSGDYDKFKEIPRPSHADFSAYVKHSGFNDIRGGGNFSGRLTAPLCFAGALCLQILEEKGIFIGAHITSIGKIKEERFNPVNVNADLLQTLTKKEFPVLNDTAESNMKAEILKAKKQLDSVGGTVECAVVGVPAGIGEPIFEGIENKLSQIIFGIPAIKGIEFGNGFDCADLLGSENNDEFMADGDKITTKTNNHGGILGGISSGMPIIFRVAIKPTPSIGKSQKSVNLKTKEMEELVVRGRHDPCIVSRAVPCIEAAAAIAITDFLL